MGDIVIESGNANSSLAIAGSQRSPIAERTSSYEGALQTHLSLPETLAGNIEDTVFISSTARQLNMNQSTTYDVSSNSSSKRSNSISNSFLKIYEQTKQLVSSNTEQFTEQFNVRENYLDHVTLSFEALSMLRE